MHLNKSTLTMKELLTLIIQNILAFEQGSKFRKGQKPFYDAIIEGLKKGWRTMYIEGPTGMGKTFIEAVLSAAMIGNSDIKILLLTSKITLLQQIQREFLKFVGFLKIGLFGGGFKNYREQVTIMTYDSFRNLDESIAKQYSVVLLDEAHKGLGEKTQAKLERQKKFSILIGFTASATYSEKKSLKKFLKNLAYKLSIIEAVELGLLANIKVLIASVDIEIESQRKGESKGDYEERISAEIIREGGNIATARLWKRVFAKRNLRGIALVLTTNQGNDLVQEFAKEGVTAELIHSKMRKSEREDMFARFKNNEFEVLVGMGIIIEGFDDVGVSVAITTYPVNSRVVMTQFPGRAERTDDENPNKVAYVVNLAYKAKKQLFYTDILDGKSEVLQKRKRRKDLDIISSEEMQTAIAKKPESYITNVAVSEKEVKEITRSLRGLSEYSREELIQLGKEELEKHGITSRVSLLAVGQHKFNKLDFGSFGKAKAFARCFNLIEGYIISQTLEALAEVFGWNDKVKTIENAKTELAKHGITNRVSLLTLGANKFRHLDFGPFGKAKAFAKCFVSVGNNIDNQTLEALAEVFGWDEESYIKDAKAELAKHGITSRVSLLAVGQHKFNKLKFGTFGKGHAFAKYFVSVGNNVTNQTLEALAEVFGWDEESYKNDALVELAKHGITSRVSLLAVGQVKFRKLDFGLFGKGTSFATCFVSLVNRNITIQTLKDLADALEWKD